MSMGLSGGINQAFPENLADLMNSGNVPNVTLQRNAGIPGPMSPRYQVRVARDNEVVFIIV